jgi:hypothetical protein
MGESGRRKAINTKAPPEHARQRAPGVLSFTYATTSPCRVAFSVDC